MDITLEGPWILYEDHTFASNTTVLVAFAPGGPGKFAHKPPTFSTGTGFPIERTGTYCVGFDQACAVDRGVKSLSHADYPQNAPEPLPVRSAANWKWYEHRDRYATYIILPMPDSYSDDETYKMSFRQKFATHDTSNEQEHSIGIQLHYNSSATGPATFDLLDCGNSPTSPADCKNLVGSQNNSGTLRITMKAPASIAEDPCDYHVRSVYPQMLKLIDPTNTYNLDKAVIDIPVGIDNAGKGVYDSKCYICDEQSQDTSQCQISLKASFTPMVMDLAGELRSLVQIFDKFEHKKELKVDELNSLAEDLHPNRFPTFPQLELLAILLSQSMDQLSRDLVLQAAKEASEPHASRSDVNQENVSSDKLKDALSREQKLSAYAISLDATKDGKDCRAPIMLLR